MIEETSWSLIIFGKSLHILKRALHILRKKSTYSAEHVLHILRKELMVCGKNRNRGDLTVATAIFPIEHGP